MQFEFGGFEFYVEPWLIAVIVVAKVVFVTIAVYWGVKAHQRQAGAGREEMVGKTAAVQQVLQPKGTVFVEGERWTAVSDGGWVEPGEEVIINRVDSLKLYVSRKQSDK